MTCPLCDGTGWKPVEIDGVQRVTRCDCWRSKVGDTLLADAGYDAEEHHRLARKTYGIRSSVIALNPRDQGRKWPKTYYRRQMKTSFPRRRFGQRWQAESVWSRHKRNLGWVLFSKNTQMQEFECQDRIMTHNLVLLALP